MSKPDKKIIILSDDELRKTFSRLTFEIIEKISNLENLLLVGIPTRGVNLAEVSVSYTHLTLPTNREV